MAEKPKFRMVIAEAIDWSMIFGQHDQDTPYKLTTGWVIGFLVESTDESITIAHTVFDDNDRRMTTTIPRKCIVSLGEVREQIPPPAPGPQEQGK